MMERIVAASVFKPQLAKALGYAFLGAILIAVSAHTEVPLWPVPVTLQTFMVALLGLTVVPSISMAAVIMYLMMGALGLPVFANGSGFATLVGPEGGYFLAFVITAMLYGKVQQYGWHLAGWRVFLVVLCGHVLTLAIGTIYLATFMPLPNAMALGFMPFLLGMVLKCFMLAILVPGLHKLRKVK